MIGSGGAQCPAAIHGLSVSELLNREVTICDIKSGTFANITIGRNSHLWGVDRASELFCVQGLKLSVRGTPMRVPRSAYLDICDVNGIYVAVDSRGVRIVFETRDASESLIVTLEVKGGAVAKRSVYSGIDPSLPLEVTHYYELTID